MSTIYKSPAGASEIRRRYREGLRTWPVPADHIHVPTRQGETFVVASGPENASPVVLLHGSGGNAMMWRSDVASWSRHFRVHAVDLIGEPGLSAPSRPPLDSDAYALWLDEVLDALGITAAPVVGISLGGWMALDYAIRRPDRVTRLALLCPGGVGRTRSAWLLKAVLLSVFGRRGVRRSARKVAGLEKVRDTSVLDDLVLTFTQFKPRTARLPTFTDEALRRLTMPMLVTVGDRDALIDSAGTAERVRRCVPQATVRLLPGVGHLIFGQTEPILTFLRA
ncbi:alpha/beta hydrolase [Nonomuraea roseoviolacea subsp. roseoviolacea]|uniref:alpha/beta fold hydrolase n=1 Tax=Nonomuraea roseoviolacea TaxID=103837 RepID=UPI0031D5040F